LLLRGCRLGDPRGCHELVQFFEWERVGPLNVPELSAIVQHDLVRKNGESTLAFVASVGDADLVAVAIEEAARELRALGYRVSRTEQTVFADSDIDRIELAAVAESNGYRLRYKWWMKANASQGDHQLVTEALDQVRELQRRKIP